jgi:hypothetical protein
MKNITRHTGKLESLKRLDGSVNGNPRYQFVVDGYVIRTAVDSSHGYSVPNFEGKQVAVTIGSHYGFTTLDSIHAA